MADVPAAIPQTPANSCRQTISSGTSPGLVAGTGLRSLTSCAACWKEVPMRTKDGIGHDADQRESVEQQVRVTTQVRIAGLRGQDGDTP